MREVATGVHVVRAGEALSTTKSPSVHMDLLMTGDGAEVIRFTFQAGAYFGLLAEPEATSMECYALLQGTLVTFKDGERIEVGPGDLISAAPALEGCMFEAVTAGVALYISTQPVFHALDTESSTLVNLAVEIEAKDGYTRDHCSRLQHLARGAALKLRLSQQQMAHLLFGSLVHDVGKVKVPADILGKAGPLTDEEWQVMRCHATWGEEMVQAVNFGDAARIVGQHHERLDGSGYPRGLKGDEICIEAQILAVCDSWDAMTTDRVYRKALTRSQAAAELRQGAGRLYDQRVVDAFFASIDYKET